ncbi:hypothetical protein AK812_SmicGene3822 [Symbiodinium microadriaticum]|uniref:Uncharacterized protein n=1 Tax=Symbiodinium microadriaticum TaxID=2951 RepID=A0A1Q9EY96_SYMMI|nr:hypothetical protein AK812_SmicGene3822 [Symbiodinium microadriaticum]
MSCGDAGGPEQMRFFRGDPSKPDGVYDGLEAQLLRWQDSKRREGQLPEQGVLESEEVRSVALLAEMENLDLIPSIYSDTGVDYACEVLASGQVQITERRQSTDKHLQEWLVLNAAAVVVYGVPFFFFFFFFFYSCYCYSNVSGVAVDVANFLDFGSKHLIPMHGESNMSTNIPAAAASAPVKCHGPVEISQLAGSAENIFPSQQEEQLPKRDHVSRVCESNHKFWLHTLATILVMRKD